MNGQPKYVLKCQSQEDLYVLISIITLFYIIILLLFFIFNYIMKFIL